MNVQRLIEMANDIAAFFAADPDRQAGVDGVANHLRKFWDPRMRRQIIAHVHEHGAAGLHELANDAIVKLAQTQTSA